MPSASSERSTGLVESDEEASPTITTRRRLHYIDFGRLELFLRRRLNEANERQNQQQQQQQQQEPAAAAVAVSTIPSPMTTQPGTVHATPPVLTSQTTRSTETRPRTWLRQANGARRRIAHRLSRVIAGCLRGAGERGDDTACTDSRKDDGRDDGEGGSFDNRFRMQTLSATTGSRPRARTSYQRCNNATGSSDRGSVLNPNREDATAKSSATGAAAGSAGPAAAAAVGVRKEPTSKALQTVDAVDIVEVEEVASAARTLSLRPAGTSGGSSPRSYATTLSAATPTRRMSLPPSASPSTAAPALTLKRPTPPRRRRQRLQQSEQRNNTSRSNCTDRTVDDRTALLTTGSETAAEIEDEDNEDPIVSLNATNNAELDSAMAQNYIKRGATGAVVGGAGGLITASGPKNAKVKSGKGGKVGKSEKSARGADEKPREFTPRPGAGSVKKLAKKQTKTRPVKRVKTAATATASHTTADKLVTLTSEGVAWSDKLESLANAPIARLYRPGAAERPAEQPLVQEDPLHDPPRSVTLRRNIECPLVPLMTYKTDKKGELFYSVVQLCQMCRKDVCPKCRRSLCAFCTAITCSDCRMLLHQMVEISRMDGGRRNRPPQGQSLVRAGSSQQRQQAQPYCHSCEKPVCLVCIDSLSMVLPTNERCAQHSLSGNVYENTCPWCGRTICRECRRSSCFACTKAFQCACQSNCQCDNRGGALPNS